MHREIKITKKDGQTEIKVDEVNGVRRTPILHLALTEAESRRLDQVIDAALYAIHAGRAALTQEEFAKLPQPETKKGKQEIVE